MSDRQPCTLRLSLGLLIMSWLAFRMFLIASVFADLEKAVSRQIAMTEKHYRPTCVSKSLLVFSIIGKMGALTLLIGWDLLSTKYL